MRISKALSLMVAPVLILGLQIGTLSTAHAAGDANLQINQEMMASNAALKVDVRNNGTDDVTQFVLSLTPTNFTFDFSFVSQALSDLDSGSDFGTWNDGTLTWNGNLKSSDTITIVFHGDETAPLGSEISFTGAIVSSQLTGAVENVDPNLADNTSNIAYTSVAKSNLNVSTRLKTTGAITESTNLIYEATIESVGPGDYVDNGFMQLAFVIPENATFIDATDIDLGDDLDILFCLNIGPLSNLNFEALNTYEYTGDAVICRFQASDGLPVGTSYKLEFEITAGSTFAAGNAEVIVLLQANDVDSYEVFRALAAVEDPISQDNGNSVHLSYDPTALAATASLCPGQPATSVDGTACFRISFNKDIVEDTFGIDDFVVTGSGSVSSLVKVGPNLWEVRIVGITLGESATITLLTNDILDLSAIESSTSVLGINTIRYEVAGQSSTANGSLPATGTNLTFALTALMFLLTGLLIRFLLKKNQANLDAKNK